MQIEARVIASILFIWRDFQGNLQPELNTVLKWLSDSQVSLGKASSDISAIVCVEVGIIETSDIVSRSSLYHTQKTEQLHCHSDVCG